MTARKKHNALREAVLAMFEARQMLELAPTHNSRAFDKALADHAVALERLSAAVGLSA